MTINAAMKFKFDNFDLKPINYLLENSREGPRWDRDKVASVEVWYRRFLLLASMYPDKVIVPTKDIDTFWHHHLLDSQKYCSDCAMLFGEYFHHFPYFGHRGDEDRDNLQRAFEETMQLFAQHFGEVPLAGDTASKPAICGNCGCRGPSGKARLNSSVRPGNTQSIDL